VYLRLVVIFCDGLDFVTFSGSFALAIAGGHEVKRDGVPKLHMNDVMNLRVHLKSMHLFGVA
jgi:hypothetical protein